VVRAVFWGSSDSVFSHQHFHALRDADCRVVGVVDVPPARRSSTNAARPHNESFVAVAQRQGIPVFEPSSPNTPAFIEQMQRLSPDLFCAAGYMLLLKAPVLAVPRVIAANFHASLLPVYRGKHPVFWALRHGESWCGLTVHEMGPALDTGDIIFQVRVPVRESDSVSALYDRIMSESMPLVSRLVACVSAGSVPRTPQPTDVASYFGAAGEKDFRLEWSMGAGVLARWINATPGQCFADIGGVRLFFLDARAVATAGKAEPGTLTRMTQEYSEIAAAGGGIRTCRVRNSEGREMGAHDAFRQMGLAEGAPLRAAAKGGQ
jgi:methionyl-tRNA formyltransferase